MYRFLALAWRAPCDADHETMRRHLAGLGARTGEGWTPAYHAPGLAIWHSGSRPGHVEARQLPGGGVVLGRILDRAEGFPEWTPHAPPPAEGAVDTARWFFANSWGAYVGFVPAMPEGTVAIFRDPGGGLPCYRVRWRGCDLFCSNLADAAALPGLALSVDLEAVAIHALLPVMRKARTGLNEVAEVLPGECLSIGGAQEMRAFPWNPIAIARDPLAVDAAEAAALLRERIRAVTAALVRPHRHVLHSLGGLDSSILLTALKAAATSPDITCVNFHTALLAGDERGYARTMAAHAGVPLVERALDPDRVDLDAWRRQEWGPSPPAGFDCLTIASDFPGLVEALGVDALSYGTGGDSVFFQAPYVYPALDFVAARGPLAQLPRVALAAAQYGGRSLAATLSAMAVERFRPTPCFDTVSASIRPDFLAPYLGSEVARYRASPRHLHPMLAPDPGFPKGKYHQLLACAFFDLESHRYRFPRHAPQDFLCPLVAQPVVELCLRIPTWQLADDGVNRGLARRAFRQDLPRAIVGRTSKSSTGGIYDAVFDRTLPMLRETLLDGMLVRAGFFDRVRLEAALAARRDQLGDNDVSLLFDFYAWEVWAAHWTNH